MSGAPIQAIRYVQPERGKTNRLKVNGINASAVDYHSSTPLLILLKEDPCQTHTIQPLSGEDSYGCVRGRITKDSHWETALRFSFVPSINWVVARQQRASKELLWVCEHHSIVFISPQSQRIAIGVGLGLDPVPEVNP